MTGERPLRVESKPCGPATVCLTVSGELDAYTADDLANRVREALLLERPSMIRLDLNGLDFIDVAGVRTLYDLHFDAAAVDCTLTISQAPQTTRWILNVLGLDDLFAVSARRPKRAETVTDGRRRRHAEPGS
ncbi:STAS domain-containing protein [Actinoplanes sp. CA-142083]|uniref:STAS domain-containing protein n=1 Tax=Actinoplanes sp. CA-142083 TaxID=3239903 RepID=UPI003D935CE1